MLKSYIIFCLNCVFLLQGDCCSPQQAHPSWFAVRLQCSGTSHLGWDHADPPPEAPPGLRQHAEPDRGEVHGSKGQKYSYLSLTGRVQLLRLSISPASQMIWRPWLPWDRHSAFTAAATWTTRSSGRTWLPVEVSLMQPSLRRPKAALVRLKTWRHLYLQQQLQSKDQAGVGWVTTSSPRTSPSSLARTRILWNQQQVIHLYIKKKRGIPINSNENTFRPGPASRHRRLGARLLPAVQECASRLRQKHLQHRQLGWCIAETRSSQQLTSKDNLNRTKQCVYSKSKKIKNSCSKSKKRCCE